MLILSKGSYIKIIKVCHVTNGWENNNSNYYCYIIEAEIMRAARRKHLVFIYSSCSRGLEWGDAIMLLSGPAPHTVPAHPAQDAATAQALSQGLLCIPEPSFGDNFISSKQVSNSVFYKALAILFKPVCQWFPCVCAILQVIHTVMKIP